MANGSGLKLKLLFLAALATRLYALLATKGMFNYDGLYQVLEPAHSIVFGYGLRTWEFSVGMRSMVYPYLVAAMFKLAGMLGVTDILSLVFISRLPSVIFSLGVVYLTYLLGCRLYSKEVGFYAGFFAVFSGLLLGLSAQIMSEVPAMFFSLASIYLFYVGFKDGSEKHAGMSGVFLGLAFMFRFAEAVYLVPMVVFAVLYKKKNIVRKFLAAFMIMLVIQGFVDLISWGSFLTSPAEFVKQNLFESRSTLFGMQPFYFYGVVFALHLSLLAIIPFAFEKKSETVYLASVLVFYIALFSLVPHKEERFMATVLPVFFVLAGRGLEKAGISSGLRLDYVILLFVLLECLAVAQYFPWNLNYDNYLAVHYVGLQRDSSGVAYDMRWFDSGIYSFLHKNIPAVQVAEEMGSPTLELVNCSAPDYFAGPDFQCSPLDGVVESRWINYAVLSNSSIEAEFVAANFSVVEKFGGVSVYRRY